MVVCERLRYVTECSFLSLNYKMCLSMVVMRKCLVRLMNDVVELLLMWLSMKNCLNLNSIKRRIKIRCNGWECRA